jgi:hypothetical protein
MATKLVRRLIATLTALLTVAGVVFAINLWRAQNRSQQVRTLADMNYLAHFLVDYRKNHGTFPKRLRTALPQERIPTLLSDGFGFALYYETKPDAFILVSFGARGKPDGIDYWALRNSPEPMKSVAGNFSADQVLSDKGWHREAGK